MYARLVRPRSQIRDVPLHGQQQNEAHACSACSMGRAGAGGRTIMPPDRPGTSAVAGAGRRPRVLGDASSSAPFMAWISVSSPGTVSGPSAVIGGAILPTAATDSCAARGARARASARGPDHCMQWPPCAGVLLHGVLDLAGRQQSRHGTRADWHHRHAHQGAPMRCTPSVPSDPVWRSNTGHGTPPAGARLVGNARRVREVEHSVGGLVEAGRLGDDAIQALATPGAASATGRMFAHLTGCAQWCTTPHHPGHFQHQARQ